MAARLWGLDDGGPFCHFLRCDVAVVGYRAGRRQSRVDCLVWSYHFAIVATIQEMFQL